MNSQERTAGEQRSARFGDTDKQLSHLQQNSFYPDTALTHLHRKPLNHRTILQLQRIIGNQNVRQLLSGYSTTRPGAKPHIHRMVLNLDPTDKAISAAAIIAQRRQGGTRLIRCQDTPEGDDLTPLSTIDSSEELTILAHGIPAIGRNEPKVANRTATELFDLLIRMGLTPAYTGVINLSNCTSAWDRKATGSFAQQFLTLLRNNGFSNEVLGFQSFTESIDDTTELEVDYGDREVFMAHKLAERYLSRVEEIRYIENEADLDNFYNGLKAGAQEAYLEMSDFLTKTDELSQRLSQFYRQMANLIIEFIDMTMHNRDNIVEYINDFQINLMDAMRTHQVDKLGGRIRKIPANPIRHS